MKRSETPHIPDSPPDVDEAEFFDGEKHASTRDQRDPGGETGFVPVDDALGQGELFGETVKSDAREGETRTGDGAALSAEGANSETETALQDVAKVSDGPVSLDDKTPQDHDDADVEEALKESFPASDPPSYSPGTASGS